MNRRQKIIWNILLWLVVIVPITSTPAIIYINNESQIKEMMPDFPYLNLQNIILSLSVSLINFIIVFYVFYFIIYYLLNRKNINGKRVFWAVLIFVILIVEEWLTDGISGPGKLTISQKLDKLSISTLIPYCIFTILQGGFAIGFRTILAYFDEKIKNKKMQLTNLKNEINMLRSQINPHFLFNALNNIDSLIIGNPEKASELLIKLSDEIRYMLYDANTEKIEIEEELKFLNNYISLQKIRIKHNDPVRINIEIDNEREKIAPLLFLPLVENAFKHGLFTNPDQHIMVNIKLKKHILDFSISNSYKPNISNAESPKGIGLDLVKRRFDLIFPDKHRFNINKNEQLFTVEFSINLG